MGKHVLIAEPRDIFRIGLRTIFQGDARVSEVFDVDSYEGLKTNFTTSLPDIVIVNQSLISDFSIFPKGCLVLLTSSLNTTQLLDAYRHGAIAYLTERVSANLLCTVLEIKEKAFLLDPTLGWWVMDALE
jgi:DNA-binding NarL/FixJ family response regulator